MRNTEVANGCREDVDTALLKLYAEQNHDSLLDLLASDNYCVLADSVPWLEKYHKCVVLLVFLKGRRRMFGRRTLLCCDDVSFTCCSSAEVSVARLVEVNGFC